LNLWFTGNIVDSDPAQLPLFTLLLRSFLNTIRQDYASGRFSYALYLGIDVGAAVCLTAVVSLCLSLLSRLLVSLLFALVDVGAGDPLYDDPIMMDRVRSLFAETTADVHMHLIVRDFSRSLLLALSRIVLTVPP
jgi:hypothetical protein